jgi:hypothetical protein
MAAVEVQISQFRQDMAAEFSATHARTDALAAHLAA